MICYIEPQRIDVIRYTTNNFNWLQVQRSADRALITLHFSNSLIFVLVD